MSADEKTGVLAGNVNDPMLAVRLIPEFDGSSVGVSEWLDKFELVCQLRGFSEWQNIVPLRLTGGAFCVYQQLSKDDKQIYAKVKEALISAFASDRFCAYEQFIGRKLRDGEAVDVYLADLRRLATLFGGMSDAGLACAFVAGLPDSARRTLRAGSRMESMDLGEILNRARAVLVEESGGVVAAGLSRLPGHRNEQTGEAVISCRSCGQPNHYARDCQAGRGERRGGRSSLRCYRCRRQGHIASSCSGNDVGEVVSAPASSPASQ